MYLVHVCLMQLFLFFFKGYGDHRDLPVLTHSFPTRRSSDLRPCRTGSVRSTAHARAHHGADSHVQTGPAPRRHRRADRRRGFPWPSMTAWRSEEHTSELQSLMSISYAVFCLKNKKVSV